MIINITEYLDATRRRVPEQIAVSDESGDTTFAQMYDESRRLASVLIEASDNHKRPIAVLLAKSARCVTAFLGALYSGNFYVPLDVNSPAARLNKILSDLDPLLVITARDHVENLQPVLGDRDDVVLIDEALEQESRSDDAGIAARIATMIDTDPIYIKYTSGSTGDPKGVVLPHVAVIDYIEWAAGMYQLDETDVIGNQAPFTFDVSVQDIYLCLKTGATLLLIPEQHFVFPAKLIEFIAERRVSYYCWVPSVLVNVCNTDLLKNAELSHLKWVTVLGEVMPTKHFKYWAQHCPDATLVNTYGPTETAIASTYYVLDREFEDDENLPIGFPCRNTETLLFDDQNQLASRGELGEICIRGSGLALGYWNAEAKTNSVFTQIPNLANYPERMYRTGDLGYINERGELMFSGRKDSQIKHMGYRIELGEIEAAASSLDEIDRACVLYNDEKKVIVLFYEAKQEVDRAAVRKTLASSLPNYMLPKTFHHVDVFPLNANGKVDRKRLMATYE